MTLPHEPLAKAELEYTNATPSTHMALDKSQAEPVPDLVLDGTKETRLLLRSLAAAVENGEDLAREKSGPSVSDDQRAGRKATAKTNLHSSESDFWQTRTRAERGMRNSEHLKRAETRVNSMRMLPSPCSPGSPSLYTYISLRMGKKEGGPGAVTRSGGSNGPTGHMRFGHGSSGVMGLPPTHYKTRTPMLDEGASFRDSLDNLLFFPACDWSVCMRKEPKRARGVILIFI